MNGITVAVTNDQFSDDEMDTTDPDPSAIVDSGLFLQNSNLNMMDTTARFPGGVQADTKFRSGSPIARAVGNPDRELSFHSSGTLDMSIAATQPPFKLRKMDESV